MDVREEGVVATRTVSRAALERAAHRTATDSAKLENRVIPPTFSPSADLRRFAATATARAIRSSK